MIRSDRARRSGRPGRPSRDHLNGRRQVRLRTSLGPDVLRIKAIRGRESVGEPFAYELELLTEQRTFTPDELIGQPVGVDIDLAGGRVRHVHGIVWQCRRLPDQGGWVRLFATLVPWLRLLEQSTDCRIFQRMSAPEIIKQVFRDHGYSEFHDALTGTYPVREYCVQYRESALDFVSRLMEEEGISYLFRHEASRHELVPFDDSPGAPVSDHCPALPYIEPDAVNDLNERVWDWSMRSDLRPARYAHTDYDFEKPNKPLLTRAGAPWDPPSATFEVFDYPGGYVHSDHGQRDSSVRIEELHADQTAFSGRSSARGIEAGRRLRLERDPFEISDYFVTTASLEIVMDQHESVRAGGDEAIVSVTFEATPAPRRFRPVRRTPRPVVRGPQTAEVVGPAGREIHTDEHGRVKVQFHWDRYGKRNDDSSCWIRVSQAWGGKGFGGVTVPRIGQEVIVDFLEGDPDRPIITGRVYNGANRASLNLPADAMKTCLRTNSLNRTGGYNEIVFDDTSGKEGLHMRSQYDHTYWVGHDRSGEVVNDSSEKVGHDLAQQVVNNAVEQVGVDKMIDVGSNLVINAGTSITLKCGASTIYMNQAGVISISGTVITTSATTNAAMVAPLTQVSGGIMLALVGGVTLVEGIATHVGGAVLASLRGGKVDVAGEAETVIKGAPIKMDRKAIMTALSASMRPVRLLPDDLVVGRPVPCVLLRDESSRLILWNLADGSTEACTDAGERRCRRPIPVRRVNRAGARWRDRGRRSWRCRWRAVVHWTGRRSQARSTVTA